MEVQEFRDSRQQKLDAFKQRYNFLRSQYSRTLIATIKEQDPQSQQQMISELLSINTEMVDELKTILGELNRGEGSFNPATINDLTRDLIQYQNDYAEVERSRDRVGTLKVIHSQKNGQLKSATVMFNIYVGVLIALAFLVAYLVIRSAWVTDVVTATTQAVSQVVNPQQ
jgi:hypothetical protein